MEAPDTSGTPASQRVAANVRAELAARQMTWTEFGETLGWSKGTISRKLNGQTKWWSEEVETAAELLGLTEVALSKGRAA